MYRSEFRLNKGFAHEFSIKLLCPKCPNTDEVWKSGFGNEESASPRRNLALSGGR